MRRTVLDAIRAAYTREPLRATTWAASLLVVAAAHAGVVLDPHDTLAVVAALAPVLLGVEHSRRKVTPTPKENR